MKITDADYMQYVQLNIQPKKQWVRRNQTSNNNLTRKVEQRNGSFPCSQLEKRHPNNLIGQWAQNRAENDGTANSR